MGRSIPLRDRLSSGGCPSLLVPAGSRSSLFSEGVRIPSLLFTLGDTLIPFFHSLFPPSSFSVLLHCCGGLGVSSRCGTGFSREGVRASSCLRGLGHPSFPKESGSLRFFSLFGDILIPFCHRFRLAHFWFYFMVVLDGTFHFAAGPAFLGRVP